MTLVADLGLRIVNAKLNVSFLILEGLTHHDKKNWEHEYLQHSPKFF